MSWIRARADRKRSDTVSAPAADKASGFFGPPPQYAAQNERLSSANISSIREDLVGGRH
jgi:hypothetical protein